MPQQSILLVGKFKNTKALIVEQLNKAGYDVFNTCCKSELIEFITNKTPLSIILECSDYLNLDAIDLTKQVRRYFSFLPIVLIVENSCESLAIRSLKAGVSDYFQYPLNTESLINSLNEKIKNYCAINMQHSKGIKKTCFKNFDQQIVGNSNSLIHVKQLAKKYAQTNSNVLITGETGTGKELIAKLVHYYSTRKDQRLVSVNCAAIPESLLESELFGFEKGSFTGAFHSRDGLITQANKGTLFLDEIGEMSAIAQAKILRAIEIKVIQKIGSKHATPVDIRVIAATNQNLECLVEEKQFRKDLFFRINIARIHLPPLRERYEDIGLLCEHFISKFNRKLNTNIKKINNEVLECFIRYEWPGNIRELKNVIEGAFINQPREQIYLNDLPQQYLELFSTGAGNQDRENDGERDKLLVALLSTNWNKSKAAEKLNWSRMTLYRKLQKYNLSKEKSHNKANKLSQKHVMN